MKKLMKILGKVLLFVFLIGMFPAIGVTAYRNGYVEGVNEGYHQGSANQSELVYTVCITGGLLTWPHEPDKQYSCMRAYSL